VREKILVLNLQESRGAAESLEAVVDLLRMRWSCWQEIPTHMNMFRVGQSLLSAHLKLVCFGSLYRVAGRRFFDGI